MKFILSEAQFPPCKVGTILSRTIVKNKFPNTKASTTVPGTLWALSEVQSTFLIFTFPHELAF